MTAPRDEGKPEHPPQKDVETKTAPLGRTATTTPQTMSSPTSPTRLRPGSRDTGFPEPFCGERNTTLPHPDANLSPNATISQDDVGLHKVLSRTKRSFLARHKRTISHGFLTPSEVEISMYSDVARHGGEDPLITQAHEAAPGTASSEKPITKMSTNGSPTVSAGRPSKDGNESLSSAGGHDYLLDGHSTKSRRGSFLRKLGFHK